MPAKDAEQLRTSAKSIGDNIAEGHGYGVGKNRLRVYRLARGSTEESLNQLRGLLDDGLLPRKEFYALFNRQYADITCAGQPSVVVYGV